jgi:hypothetical protein
MAQVTLDAFLRRASRHAENIFNEDGELEFYIIAQLADGKVDIMVVPDATRGSPPDAAAAFRDSLAIKLREMFRDRGVVKYAVIAEYWMGKMPPVGESISTDPDRQEVVAILAADKDRGIYATREIIRPERRRPYLGKLEMLANPSGRFTDLLMPMVQH